MSKVAIAVHGGAGNKPKNLKTHLAEYEAGIEEALRTGHQLLKKGANAVRAVEAAVMILEDNPYFNAGKGSVLNDTGEVEMDASIMDGKTLKAGAVSIVRRVKNPIMLARNVMMKTKHVLLSGEGALKFAKDQKLVLKPDSYFITQHQYDDYLKSVKQNKHGTVGAVAMDRNGNLAAATSTGGTHHSMPGRVGDSCQIGAGCYANNKTCAISGTGIGEHLIRGVVAHTISMMIELKRLPLSKACEYVIHQRSQKGTMGVIAIDNRGKISLSFNTPTMHRGYIDVDGKIMVAI